LICRWRPNFITDNFVEARFVVAIAFFDRFPDAVVSQTAHITAACRDDFVEQKKFRVATVGDVQPIQFDDRFQYGTLIVFAASVSPNLKQAAAVG
jgi:hypothetical protein